jgi:hypothetical protein
MVPSPNWGDVAEGFGASQARQAVLCARCVFLLGDTTPPQYIVILDGESFCLDHLPRP